MIGLIDYGVGNINAFLNIYKQLGVEARKVSNSDEISDFSKLILPGVGSFDDAMSRLNASGMREALEEAVKINKIPIIGICVGMQMLAEKSDEGKMSGLGWIKGTVKRFDPDTIPYTTKFPHMGWNNFTIMKDNPLVANFETVASFYFLHSYYFDCQSEENVLAVTDYGIKFASAIHNENIYGIQCHPEKSHHDGVKLLQNFANL